MNNTFTNDFTKNEIMLQKYFHNKLKEKELDVTGVEGEGLVDFILNREPISCKIFMYRHKNEIITSLRICRIPINHMIYKLANWVSHNELEKYKQNLHIDNFFHLYLEVNNKYQFERNETVSFIVSSNVGNNKDNMSIDIRNNKSKNIEEFVDNTINLYPNIWRYNAVTNNCQIFIKQLLTANNLWNEMINKFVIQDVSIILSKEVEKKLNLVTDAGGLMSKLIHFMPFVNWFINLRTLKKT